MHMNKTKSLFSKLQTNDRLNSVLFSTPNGSTETCELETNFLFEKERESQTVRSAFYILCYTGIMKMCHGSTFDF